VVGHAYADAQEAQHDPTQQASYRRYLRQLYRTLPAEEGRVYDAANRLVFREGQAPTYAVPTAWLEQVRRSGRAVLEPEANYHETVGLLFHHARLGPLVVVASSIDEDSRDQLAELQQLLAGGLVAALAIGAVASWVFAGRALRPLRQMVQEVDGITATDLSQRLTQAAGSTDEIGRLAQRFNLLLERLQSAFAGQRTFVRDASHELRTPLAALIGELEVALLQAERRPAEYRRVLQSTLDSSRQLNELTNGLLQIARASDDPSHFTVRGNEALLLSAVLNVLDNACKFSAGSAGTVTATLTRADTRIMLLVADEGPGLSGQDMQQVFVPFFRAASARSVPGHGIGLPLTARIMALHGGHVRLESEPGEGTHVWLEWPRQPRLIG
jgi:signal transduction histidine kinase